MPNSSSHRFPTHISSGKKRKYLTKSQTYHLNTLKPSLAASFASLLSDKISSFRFKISSNPSPVPPHSNPPLTSNVLSFFPPASIDETAKCLHDSPSKQCCLDPILIFIIKEVSEILLIITTMVNLFTGTFPIHFNQSLVTPLRKNYPK